MVRSSAHGPTLIHLRSPPVPRLRLAALAFLLLIGASPAFAQSYTSVVVIGDSLSDTGNDAHLVQSSYGARYPGPLFNYADGRFTDGTSTVPAAVNFTGVWVEQLAATLATHPVVTNSLDGGTDYAFGDATTANGTHTASTTFAGITYSIVIDDMGQQVTNYLAAHPTVPANTLIIVWGGANDLAALVSSGGANASTIVPAAANREVALVQRLITAGATDILVPNLPPLGDIPRFNGQPAVVKTAANSAAALFNTTLAAGLANLPAANSGATLHLFSLDTYALFTAVIGPPITNGLTNVTVSAQGMAGVNPDQYLFWDDLHPTTAGHHLLAQAAGSNLAPAVATTTTVTSSALTANVGAVVTFTANVTATAGSPSGTVTFSDGATALGTGTLTTNGTTTSAATLSTSSLTAGAHTITAAFAGSTGFLASTSAAITQTITAPAITAALSPTSITVASGASATSTLTLTPTGGYSSTATAACGALPAHFACTLSTSSFNFTGDGAAQTATVTIATNNTATLTQPHLVSPTAAARILSALLLPWLGLSLLRRRRPRASPLSLLSAVLLLGSLATLAGCGGSSHHNAPAGTYTVPITITASSATSTVNLSVVVQ